MSEVLVVDLRSLSYTGTTWLNLLVGSHPDAFTLGAPQRAYAARRGEVAPPQLCRVHGEACDFWPAAFAADKFAAGNLYVEVARAATVPVVVINNPFVDPDGVSDLLDDRVSVLRFAIVRDPRAVAWSYQRRHGGSAEQAAQWVVDHAYLVPIDEAPVIRYEAAAEDPSKVLTEVGDKIGLVYPAESIDYFRFTHHPVGGNPTPFAVVARHLAGTPSSDDQVEQRYQQAIGGSGSVTIAEGWRGFSAADLETVESITDPIARRWGYR